MGSHSISVSEVAPYDWRARCRCGWASDPKRLYRTRDMVMDQVRGHEAVVERARAARNRGTSSLTADERYYRAMSENENVSQEDRLLWKQLADEVATRIGRPPTAEQQPELDLLFATEE